MLSAEVFEGLEHMDAFLEHCVVLRSIIAVAEPYHFRWLRKVGRPPVVGPMSLTHRGSRALHGEVVKEFLQQAASGSASAFLGVPGFQSYAPRRRPRSDLGVPLSRF